MRIVRKFERSPIYGFAMRYFSASKIALTSLCIIASNKASADPRGCQGEGLAIPLGVTIQFAWMEIRVIARCKAPIIARKSEHRKLNGHISLPRCIPLFICYVDGVMDSEKTNSHWDQDTSLLMLR